jgi:hypothetical protein
LVLVIGAAGLCMHAVFWNIIHGGMSRVADLPSMLDFLNQTEGYPPFIAALMMVILFANAGLVLAALTLWRSGTVPWWAGAAAAVFPLNDLFGAQGWPYVVCCLLWTLGWGVAGVALVRRRDESGRVGDGPTADDAAVTATSPMTGR